MFKNIALIPSYKHDFLFSQADETIMVRNKIENLSKQKSIKQQNWPRRRSFIDN